MTTRSFYPYPIHDGLSLSVNAIEPALKMDTGSRYLRLWEVPEESWRLVLDIEVPDDATARVLPPGERSHPPLAIALTLRSDTSRRRAVIEIPFEAGQLRHDLVLEHDEWTGLVNADLSLVRTSDTHDRDGHWAWAKHTVVGTAETVKIDIDEPIRLPGDSLQIEWVNFNEDPSTWLNSHADNLFALRSPSYGDAPILYLNEAVPSAVSVLTNTGSHGHTPRTRDATFQMIAHQVWSSVLGAALGELADSSDPDKLLDEALEEIDPWMPQILRDWAPWLFPQADARGALEELWEQIAGGNWEKMLINRLPNAIQSRFGTIRGLEGLITEFGL